MPRVRRPRASLHRIGPALLGLALAAGATAAEAATPGWRRIEVPEAGVYALRYLPPGLDQGQPAPVVVFLHGSGGLPEHYQLQLASPADEAGVVLLLPKSLSTLGFGPGDDEATIDEALRLLGEELALDPERISLAGHSGGGAYAAVLAYARRLRFSGVFILAAPYRVVLALADPDYVAPIRMVYGDQDPNYQGSHHLALAEQWQRLGVPWELEVAPGYGHSSWPLGTLSQGFAFLRAQRYRTPGGCLPSETRLCLRQGRFAVEASWRTPQGESGPARVTEARTPDSGLFYFFRPGNWELQVKVLDGCTVNGRFWVFAAGTSSVEHTLTVTDLATGYRAQYSNAQGVGAPPILDVEALPTCP